MASIVNWTVTSCVYFSGTGPSRTHINTPSLHAIFSHLMQVPIPDTAEDPEPSLELTIAMPPGYPSSVPLRASCRIAALQGLKRQQELTRGLQEYLNTELAVGNEAVLEVAGWVVGKAEALLQEQRQQTELGSPVIDKDEALWRRWVYWVDHLMEDKQNKKVWLVCPQLDYGVRRPFHPGPLQQERGSFYRGYLSAAQLFGRWARPRICGAKG